MKQNICIIGLSNSFTKKVAKSIADAFEMFFADITDLINFDLLDVEKARKLCGEEYIHKVERIKVKTVATFENTLFTMDYSLLNDDDNLKITKDNAYIIYLKLTSNGLANVLQQAKTKENEIALKLNLYEFRNSLCEKYSDIVINCDGKNMSQILSDVGEAFLRKGKNGN